MIQEGDYALFKKGDTTKIFQIKSKKPYVIEKFKCFFDNLIGQPYGFEYQIVDKQFQRRVAELNSETNEAKIVLEEQNESKDNRNLNDEASNQKLSREEIELLKSNLDGDEMIEKLIENSDTFNTKTEFSKQKYLKKKKNKYLAVFQVQRPTGRTLCDYFMQGKMKRKILNMRVDTVAQILTYTNVAAHRNILMIENSKGLLLAAVVERLGGFGSIINLSPNGVDNGFRQTLGYMNFKPNLTDIVQNFPLEKIDKLDEYLSDLKTRIEIATNPDFKLKQTKKLEQAEEVYGLLKNQQIDCLILATKYNPLPILERVINYLPLNRYFTIYYQIQEPLLDCYKYLKANGKAIHMELSDSWLRDYQVLPERTHPKMQMDCCGGYLLTGITSSK